MREHRLEVADVFHAHQQEFLQRWGHVVSRQQRKVLRAIGRCRTAALGSHLERCDSCSYEYVAFDSCRDRHCPKCQSTARDRWLQKQASSLLPVPYSHVVFTLPRQLAALALRNQRLIYALMFRAVSETLMEIAADRHRLGARIGILAVLHTWNQRLQLHPHLHCLVPAGAPGTRPITLDRLSAALLPSGAGAQLHVPWQDAGLSQTRLRQPPTALPGHSSCVLEARPIPRTALHAAPSEMGRLCQGTFRRS
jgi:hypothetical protein